MGEPHSGDGLPGPRRAHPGNSEPGAGLEALLAAALRVDHVDGEAEQRAVHAYRAARQAGAHQARTRRRDDWSPRGLRGARSLRTTLSVLLAGFTLGGVAYAAIGAVDSPSRGAGDGRPPASSPATGRPGQRDTGPAAPVPPSASAERDRPGTARDTEARCRAYERVKGRGESLEATAWRWLVDAAGSEKKVDGYCARRLGEGRGEGGAATPGRSDAPDVPDIPAVPTPDVPALPTAHTTAGPIAGHLDTPPVPDLESVTEDVLGTAVTRPDLDRDGAASR
ncbi:hypothetical protein ABZ354_24630 [Streptomyces sp. NPDC005925]|uniref:hypothetical protein n=1 Tax=Streptomyces sp. NPDC005925 TaxID=3157172 RepID=UPI0033C79246